MSLQQGQIIRYENALWRVDYVNECRARIVPLVKRRVVLRDEDGDEKRTFDAERGGVNISPNSLVDVVTDVERAKDEIELAKAEEELNEVKRALAAVERSEAAPKVKEPPTKAAPKAASPLATSRVVAGWRVGSVPAPAFREGSLAAIVMARIQAEPGLDTKTLVATVKAEGNVASCISRFSQAGYIEK